MENTINFGIDLGTTNSVIAKFVKGEVQVFKNPTDWKDTLSSVVYFKKNSIIVGGSAKTYYGKDAKNVFSTFKRKMGTSESYKVAAINQSKTPIELSAYVLKELKTFIPSGETIDATVITIPASFDTIQSNATKEAGLQAGFKQVILLQEPIAASLAYANKAKETELNDGQWLVYDLGGGTFDVALVKIQNGEMKIIDHEGDNFLGGSDFDRLIIEKIVIPHLEKLGKFNELEKQMKSASGKYNAKYLEFVNKAEEKKVILSAKTSTEIELIIEDEEGNEIDEELTITRSEFENIIKEYIDNTIEMVKKIITRNSLTKKDLQFILMVGGSTYIPFVRKRVEEILEVPVNCDIDPTTAIAIGAAFYAGTKQKNFENETKTYKEVALKIKLAYQKVSKEKEEFFAAKIEGKIDNLFYKIIREDNGYNSGIKPLTKQIQEDLPLVENAYNFFKFLVYDSQNNLIETDVETIGIAQGKYGVAGQPLPNDICLEIDDFETKRTKLELIFQKNSVLPIKKTVTKKLNKTIIKGSDESLRINILEGSYLSLPEANLSIGYMEIKGNQISRDISKGSDVEITIEISESRDLTIYAYVNMADQEFKQTFNPKARHTPVHILQEQVNELSERIENEYEEATQREEYETAGNLKKLKDEIKEINKQSEQLTNDDVTDIRYQLEDKKRKIAQEVDNATKDKRLQIAKAEYFEEKESCLKLVSEYGNDYEQKILNDIQNQEQAFLSTNSPLKIQEKTDELHALVVEILWKTPAFLVGIFKDLSSQYNKMNDLGLARNLFENGKIAIQNQDWERLGEINMRLINLLSKTGQNEIINKSITGLS